MSAGGSVVPHRDDGVHCGQDLFAGSQIGVSVGARERHRVHRRGPSDEGVEVGCVAGLDLAFAVVGSGQHDLDRAAEIEDDAREHLVSPARKTRDADEIGCALRGQRFPDGLGNERHGRCGQVGMPVMPIRGTGRPLSS